MQSGFVFVFLFCVLFLLFLLALVYGTLIIEYNPLLDALELCPQKLSLAELELEPSRRDPHLPLPGLWELLR